MNWDALGCRVDAQRSSVPVSKTRRRLTRSMASRTLVACYNQCASAKFLQYIFATTVCICIVGDAGGCRGAKAEVGMKQQTNSASLSRSRSNFIHPSIFYRLLPTFSDSTKCYDFFRSGNGICKFHDFARFSVTVGTFLLCVVCVLAWPRFSKRLPWAVSTSGCTKQIQCFWGKRSIWRVISNQSLEPRRLGGAMK